MKRLNDAIKNCKYDDSDFRKIQIELEKITQLPIILYKIVKGQAVYRCRKNKLDDLYNIPQDISYRSDIENINIGRCNLGRSSKFYGSIVSNMVAQGYVTAVFETSSLHRNKTSGLERFSVGMWTFKNDFEAFVILPNPDDKEISSRNPELSALHADFIKQANANAGQIEFMKLMGTEFSKNVRNGDSIQYGISATISEYLFSKGIKAIAYPSVQSGHIGYNIVFNPDFADSILELQRILVGDLFKFDKEAFFNNFLTAEYSNGVPFVYKRVEAKYSATIDQIVEQFLAKGITVNKIIYTLANQIVNM